MSKNKSGRSLAITEMHFVSALPLEASVRLLSDLASTQTPVTLTEVNSDLWRFEIAYFPPKHKTAASQVKGTLRRWQGTFTGDTFGRFAPQELNRL